MKGIKGLRADNSLQFTLTHLKPNPSDSFTAVEDYLNAAVSGGAMTQQEADDARNNLIKSATLDTGGNSFTKSGTVYVKRN